jgi:SAM-dependent methyltransferase
LRAVCCGGVRFRFMSLDAVRSLAAQLNGSVLTLAALGSTLEARINRRVLTPSIAAAVDGVLDAVGAKGALEDVAPAELRPLLAEIQVSLRQAIDLASPASRREGWTYTDETMLRAAGEVSAAFPRALQKIAPLLSGLSQRLESADAAFLDVGVGVAALSIEMARLWPSLRIVGIDPWEPSLVIGRRNVGAAGLEGRIELRLEGAESLTFRETFDLGWIPSVFIPGDVIDRVVQRVHAALRPGGWVVVGTVNPGSDPAASAIARLRASLFGGFANPTDISALLNRVGFVDVRTLPAPPHAIAMMIAGRRAEA